MGLGGLLLLLLRHSVTSSIAHEERMATRLHLPHAIVMRLHAHYIIMVILTPETVCLSSSLSLPVGFSIQDEAMDVDQSRLYNTDEEDNLIRLKPCNNQTLTQFHLPHRIGRRRRSSVQHTILPPLHQERERGGWLQGKGLLHLH